MGRGRGVRQTCHRRHGRGTGLWGNRADEGVAGGEWKNGILLPNVCVFTMLRAKRRSQKCRQQKIIFWGPTPNPPTLSGTRQLLLVGREARKEEAFQGAHRS